MCRPSILKCSYFRYGLMVVRSMHPLILSVPFFGTGKKADHTPPCVRLICQGADRADGEVVLQSVPAGLELLGLACQGSCRVEGLVERWWAVGPFEGYVVGQDLDMPGTCDSFP